MLGSAAPVVDPVVSLSWRPGMNLNGAVLAAAGAAAPEGAKSPKTTATAANAGHLENLIPCLLGWRDNQLNDTIPSPRA
jgi:hypothetical protein